MRLVILLLTPIANTGGPFGHRIVDHLDHPPSQIEFSFCILCLTSFIDPIPRIVDTNRPSLFGKLDRTNTTRQVRILAHMTNAASHSSMEYPLWDEAPAINTPWRGAHPGPAQQKRMKAEAATGGLGKPCLIPAISVGLLWFLPDDIGLALYFQIREVHLDRQEKTEMRGARIPKYYSVMVMMARNTKPDHRLPLSNTR